MAKSGATAGKIALRELEERIYQVTRQIPAGQVATYGQVALVAGVNSARLVGRAMATLPAGSDVPWHRVINSQGKISIRRHGGPDPAQKRRLRAEGGFLRSRLLLDRDFGRLLRAAEERLNRSPEQPQNPQFYPLMY